MPTALSIYANEFISRNRLQCNTLCVTLRPSMSAHTAPHIHSLISNLMANAVCERSAAIFAFASQLNRVKIEGVQRITIYIACCFRLCFPSQKFVFYLYLFNGSRLNVCIDGCRATATISTKHLSIHGRAIHCWPEYCELNNENAVECVDREPVGSENAPCGVSVSSVVFFLLAYERNADEWYLIGSNEAIDSFRIAKKKITTLIGYCLTIDSFRLERFSGLNVSFQHQQYWNHPTSWIKLIRIITSRHNLPTVWKNFTVEPYCLKPFCSQFRNLVVSLMRFRVGYVLMLWYPFICSPYSSPSRCMHQVKRHACNRLLKRTHSPAHWSARGQYFRFD